MTAGAYTSIISVGVNAAGQVTSIVGGGCTTSCGMPALASFSWVNQGGATATQPVSGGPIGMSLPDVGGSSNAWRGLFLATPNCPWKVTVTIRYSVPNTGAVATNGLYLYNGTKLIGFESLYIGSGYQQRVEHITNVVMDGTTVYGSNTGWVIRNDYNSPLNIQIRDDCTNYYFDSSVDGISFNNLYSEAIGSYITATNVGFAADQSQAASSPGFMSLETWQTYPNSNLNGP